MIPVTATHFHLFWLTDRRQGGENGILCRRVQAMRMPESAGTDAWHLTGLRRDVVDDVVVAGGRYAPRHVVAPKRMARLPRDRMIGARCVPTDADGAESLTGRTVNRQPAARSRRPKSVGPPSPRKTPQFSPCRPSRATQVRGWSILDPVTPLSGQNCTPIDILELPTTIQIDR